MGSETVSLAPVDLGDCLGRGGEATIFTLKADPTTLVKLYHHPTPERSQKLAVMIDHPPAQRSINGHPVIAWPTRRVLSREHGRFSGFLMPRVARGVPAANLHNMKSRLLANPHFNWKYLVRAAMNMALTFQKVHAGGYVIGDVNDQGVLVAENALVALVDCDSFQVNDPNTGRIFRCTVGTGLFAPPELAGCNFAAVDRSQNHDLFGLAVMIYQLLMGSHPFQVKTSKHDDVITIEDCIREGLYPDLVANVTQSPASPPLDLLPSGMRDLLRSAFGPPGVERPTAARWADELWAIDREQRSCARNHHHFFAAHLANCPWCEWVARVGGRDPFPSPEAIRAGEHLKRAPWLRTRVSPRPRFPTAAWSRAGTTPASKQAPASRYGKFWGSTGRAAYSEQLARLRRDRTKH